MSEAGAEHNRQYAAGKFVQGRMMEIGYMKE